MYNLYKDAGGTDSENKFGRVLTDNGILLAKKSVKGSGVKMRVGVRLLKDDPQWRKGGDDEDIDDYTHKKREHYPPSNYVPPPV